jgi:hypothetical protein
VARYQPAARDAEVGGDWYDAFSTVDGTVTLVVGDVAGHDSGAAAAMADAGRGQRTAADGGCRAARPPVDELCDALLERLVDLSEDDVVLLAARVQDGPPA